MASPLLNIRTRVTGEKIISTRLRLAGAKILGRNHAMVTEMLHLIKEDVAAKTPLGPGRGGHLRNQYVVDVHSDGVRTMGVLKAPSKGYWYEFGTGARYRGKNKRLRYANAVQASTGGEKAHRLATHAASAVKRIIIAYYGGLAKWWA